MFKKLLICLVLFLWATGLKAQTLTVYQPWPVGALNDLICRQLFKIHAEQTGLNTVVINRPGADTMLAHRELLNHSGLGLLCGGNGPVFYTTFKDSPKDAPAFNTVKPVLGVMKGTSFVFVPGSGPNNLDELIKKHKASGKSILIGNLSRAGNFPMEYILNSQGVKLEFVSSTNPGATLASLKDGSLDVYVDGGTLRPQLVNFAKEIAHIGLGGYKGSSEGLQYLPKRPCLTVK
jgi:tripartite-type tricarboxylate transporter receptor subunit TctC